MALVVAAGAAAGPPEGCSRAIDRLKGGALPERVLIRVAPRTKWQEVLVLRFRTEGTIGVADVDRDLKVMKLTAEDMYEAKVWKLEAERKPTWG